MKIKCLIGLHNWIDRLELSSPDCGVLQMEECIHCEKRMFYHIKTLRGKLKAVRMKRLSSNMKSKLKMFEEGE